MCFTGALFLVMCVFTYIVYHFKYEKFKRVEKHKRGSTTFKQWFDNGNLLKQEYYKNGGRVKEEDF